MVDKMGLKRKSGFYLFLFFVVFKKRKKKIIVATFVYFKVFINFAQHVGRVGLGGLGALGGAVEIAVEVQVDKPGLLVHDRDGDGLLALEGLLGRQGGGAVGGGDPDDELAAGVDRDAGLAALAEHAGRRWRRSRRWARAT